MNHHNPVSEASLSERVGDAVDQFTQQIESGETPDVEQFLLEFPDLQDVLRPLLTALVEIEQGGLEELGNGRPQDRRLGDFRILREIARGGMGIVHQAEQISLGREVALKVLPFASMVDAKALERFRNEVRLAASLEHSHIVSVYSVGEERGVHFYAMQLIRGQSMAAVISALQKLRHADIELSGSSISEVMARSGDSPDIFFETTAVDDKISSNHEGNGHAQQATRALNKEPTIKTPSKSSTDKNYYCNVARLGIQAAKALAHAHENGIIHRDIKPGNLMLDADCQLYITDFGLARIEAAGITMTGDWLGTPRYMAPEQALGKQVVIDHRADIYSLGVTLYELLTLQAAFDASDRQALLSQIANAEPTKPRTIDRRIPRELETIVLTSISKEAGERYQTVQELADDLRRFLEDKPIVAKPSSLVNQVRKWSQRHTGILSLAIVALLAVCIILSVYRNVATMFKKQGKHEIALDYFLTAWDYQRAIWSFEKDTAAGLLFFAQATIALAKYQSAAGRPKTR